MTDEPRKCNVGPVPEYDVGELTNAFIAYIDHESCDAKLFELGDYAKKDKSGGLSLPWLAKLSYLIIVLLQVAPAARLHKTDVKKSFLNALAQRPRRVIFPKIPKPALSETVSRQVVKLLGNFSIQNVFEILFIRKT